MGFRVYLEGLGLRGFTPGWASLPPGIQVHKDNEEVVGVPIRDYVPQGSKSVLPRSLHMVPTLKI